MHLACAVDALDMEPRLMDRSRNPKREGDGIIRIGIRRYALRNHVTHVLARKNGCRAVAPVRAHAEQSRRAPGDFALCGSMIDEIVDMERVAAGEQARHVGFEIVIDQSAARHRVKRDACGGCYNRIPPQRQLDIRMSKKIIVCEYCGRILVSDQLDEEAAEQ